MIETPGKEPEPLVILLVLKCMTLWPIKADAPNPAMTLCYCLNTFGAG